MHVFKVFSLQTLASTANKNIFACDNIEKMYLTVTILTVMFVL